MREPRPRHTLQVIRVPSLEVQDLGLTSFDSWLDENGYDKTNARNNRTIWAREGGWHLKRCRNLKLARTISGLSLSMVKAERLPAENPKRLPGCIS
jgi:hypothetical protein